MATKSKKGVGSKKTASKKKVPIARVAKSKKKAQIKDKKTTLAEKPGTAKSVKPTAKSKVQSKVQSKAPNKELKKEQNKMPSEAEAKPPTTFATKPAPKPEAKLETKKPVVLPEPVKGQVITEDEKKWRECIEKVKGTVPVAYNMSGQFSVKAIIEHKVLGLGYVNSILNDRLEVFFKDGVRTLISNWKKN